VGCCGVVFAATLLRANEFIIIISFVFLVRLASQKLWPAVQVAQLRTCPRK
jgi:hypothetical protein